VQTSARFHEKPNWGTVCFVEFQKQRFIVELVNVVDPRILYHFFQFVNYDGNVEACEFFLWQEAQHRGLNLLA
jgi:hypothetical protein